MGLSAQHLFLINRDPLPDSVDVRLRRFVDAVRGILNGLLEEGLLVPTGGGGWGIGDGSGGVVNLFQVSHFASGGPVVPVAQTRPDVAEWLTGTAEPKLGLGRAGDFYLQTNVAADAIEVLVPGPPGPPGIAGPPGPAGSGGGSGALLTGTFTTGSFP